MQASKVDQRRKTPEQKGASPTTVLEEKHLLLKEQVRKLTEQLSVIDDVFEGAWGGEPGGELCGIAEAVEKYTVMSTMSPKE